MSWVRCRVRSYRRVMSNDHDTRVSTADRSQALEALAAHRAAGRLDAFEYEDRRGRAGDADWRSELDALFVDLPPLAGVGATTHNDEDAGRSACMGLLQRPYSWVPLVATALFFFTHQWVWFLLIPASTMIAGRLGSKRHHGFRADGPPWVSRRGRRRGCPTVRS